ncbi:MAG: thioredoxin domain-containing protein [Sphingomonadaceae bacterium]
MVARPFAALLVMALAACGDASKTEATGAAPKAAASAAGPGAAATPATRDWTRVVEATPEGGFRMGNPDAPVKIIEFASLTCPACRNFHQTGVKPLKDQYVASGRVSYEFRNFVLNGADLAATLLARCQGASGFFPLADAFFTNQEAWLLPFTKLTAEEQRRLQALPPERQVTGFADAGQLDAFVRVRGIPRARYEACLSDQQAIGQLERIQREAVERYRVQGTPTFVLNGETLNGVLDWPTLEQRIKDRLG